MSLRLERTSHFETVTLVRVKIAVLRIHMNLEPVKYSKK